MSAAGRTRLQRLLKEILPMGALAYLFFALSPVVPAFLTSAERTLYFKLPIEGVRFHWVFLEPEAFLAGELTLRIINTDRDETITVFRDGKITDGWEMIGDTKPERGFYFGFSSTTRVRTKANDSIIVTLKAPRDLRGQGPHSEGVLAAGVWQMSGSYSAIYGGRWSPLDLIVLNGDPPVALLECWSGVWPITVTKQEGWKGPAQPEEPGFLQTLMKERGTNGRVCRSHV